MNIPKINISTNIRHLEEYKQDLYMSYILFLVWGQKVQRHEEKSGEVHVFIGIKIGEPDNTNVPYFKYLREWRGLTVSIEDCHSKSRRFESRPFSFFFSQKNRKTTKVSRQEKNEKQQPLRSGERKKKDQQANQEWIRETVWFIFEDD